MRGLLALILGVLVGLGAPALALDAARPVTQYGRQSWTDGSGLPQNTVLSLAQTRDGYLWVGTWEGLARFDGLHLTVFDKRNTPALRDSLIRSLAEDARGTLWVGTGRGLVSYRDGRFQREALGTELAEQEVVALAPDPDGSLWVGTKVGVFHLQEGKARHQGAAEGLPGLEVRALVVDEARRVWAGTEQGLARLDGGRWTPVPLPDVPGPVRVRALHAGRGGVLWAGTEAGLVRLHEGDAQRFTPRDGLPAPEVTALWEDRDGSLWVGTLDGQLARRAQGSFSVLGPREGFRGGGVLALREDREGNLWVGTLSEGLQRLRDGAFLSFGLSEGFVGEPASVVLEDSRGVLWVGTHGAGLYRRQDGVFSRLGEKEGLTQDSIRTLAEGPDGTLWVGTSMGAWHFDGQRFTRVGLQHGLAEDFLSSVFVDSRGDVWFGSAEGLTRLRPGSLTRVPVPGAPTERINAITEDTEGVLWFGTVNGLVRLAGGTFTRFTTADGLVGDQVMDLYADPRGGLWVGTLSGLTLLRHGRFTRFTTAQGLSDDVIYRILEDGDGYLWMSCNKGVSRVSRRELEEVAEGRRAAVHPSLFDHRDGMRSSDCNGAVQPSGWRTREGWLWFPTMRGLVAVDPSRVEASRPRAEPRLEEVRVQQGGPVPHASGSLVLEPGQRDVEFRFSVLALSDSSRLPMRYRLEGYETEWVDAGDRRSVTYSNLAPGDYRFVVTAANRDGVWTEPGVAVALRLTPFFHETPAFLLLCVLGVGALGWGAYAWRVRRLRERERRLQARVDERTRELAAANRELDENLRALRQAQAQLVQAGRMVAVGTLAAGVGHEINNPLAYIVSNLEFASTEATLLERELPAASPGRGRLEDMQRALREARHGADRVRLIVRDLKTLSRGDEERREPVDLHAVLDSAAKLAGNELLPRARLVREFGQVPPVDGNESRLVQVFLNLLINAAQALPEGQAARHEVLLVTRCEGPERVVAEVRDTGSGMAPEVVGRIFDPFFTTKPVGVGTGLGLALCHRFVTAMGGDISVESEPGRGTVVRVTLRAAAAVTPVTSRVHPVEEQKEEVRVRGRVLIVDDDVMVSSAVRRTLAREHDVEVLTSSRAALELLQGPRGAELDVILCDLMMPDLTGMEVHAALVEAAPAVASRMVFVTGGAFTPAAREFLERVENARVDKPFEPSKLREQVRGWVAKARAGEPGRAA